MILLTSCPAARPKPEDSATQTRPVAEATISHALLQRLSMIARDRPLSAEAASEWSQRLSSGDRTVEQYVDWLIADTGFSDELMPRLLFKQRLRTFAPFMVLTGYWLKQTQGKSGREIYYLEERCDESKAVEVNPWWDLKSTVLVCESSYRPDVFISETKDGNPTYCASTRAAKDPQGRHSSRCGCGANLFRCITSAEEGGKIYASVARELTQTVAYWVRNDMPYETLLTANSSFRDRNAEYARRRDILEGKQSLAAAEALSDLSSWPEEGKWAPREELAEGQHAGVLTVPQFVYYLTDRRQRLRDVYDIFWCQEPASVGATPEAVFTVDTPDLELDSENWDDLAKRPLCTNCHARLDYGRQFMAGYPDGIGVATHFVPSMNLAEVGPMYGASIEDKRADRPMNPREYGKILTEQPEFTRCMARHVGEHVFGDQYTSNIAASLERGFDASKTTARELFRRALLLYVAQVREEPTEPAPEPPVASWTSAGLEDMVEEHCSDCHGEGSGLPRLEAAQRDRDLLAAMLKQVAFGTMPKGMSLPTAEREAMERALIAEIWQDPGDREEAVSYYRYRRGSLHAQSITAAFAAQGFGASGGAGWTPAESLIRSDKIQIGPSYLGAVGLGAIGACSKVETKEGAAACIEQRLDLDAFLTTHAGN